MVYIQMLLRVLFARANELRHASGFSGYRRNLFDNQGLNRKTINTGIKAHVIFKLRAFVIVKTNVG
jgi:hypothetical protein